MENSKHTEQISRQRRRFSSENSLPDDMLEVTNLIIKCNFFKYKVPPAASRSIHTRPSFWMVCSKKKHLSTVSIVRNPLVLIIRPGHGIRSRQVYLLRGCDVYVFSDRSHRKSAIEYLNHNVQTRWFALAKNTKSKPHDRIDSH